MNDCLRQVLSTNDPDSVIDFILKSAGHYFEVHRVFLCFKRENKWLNTHIWDFETNNLDTQNREYFSNKVFKSIIKEIDKRGLIWWVLRLIDTIN